MYHEKQNPGAEAGASNSIALGGASEQQKYIASETKRQCELPGKNKADRIRRERAKGRPKLTRDREIELLEIDPQKGEIRHAKSRGGKRAGDIAGTISNGYNVVFVDYWPYKASHLIWLFVTGELPPKGKVIDHINGIRDDDRWGNLRLCTPAENARNRGKCSRNTSGKVGVHPLTGLLWGAEIGVGGKNIKLGRFECKEAAIEARCAAERHYFGEFARRAG
jgi:hypothetical protein